mgnify:CR=1 FL=1
MAVDGMARTSHRAHVRSERGTRALRQVPCALRRRCAVLGSALVLFCGGADRASAQLDPLLVIKSSTAMPGGPARAVVVIEFPDGLHEYVTTPVRRILRIAGQEVYYLQTTNSRYRLEVRRSVPVPAENTFVR